MVKTCIHSSVYSFERGYISPGPSLSFLPKQRWGDHFVIVSSVDYQDIKVSPTKTLTIGL